VFLRQCSNGVLKAARQFFGDLVCTVSIKRIREFPRPEHDVCGHVGNPPLMYLPVVQSVRGEGFKVVLGVDL